MGTEVLSGKVQLEGRQSRHSAVCRRLQVGAVSYLNTKPLVYGLQQQSPGFDLVYDVPSRLADQLAAGELDVALIPSVEYLRNPRYAIVSDACIGCRGPVLSVKLLSRVPMRSIRSLALDEGSRTSAVLAQILLREQFGLQPQLRLLPLGCDPQSCPADAILLIGDRAIHPPAGGYVASWDLGERWWCWAQLPFVFALWVARPRVAWEGLEAKLAAARDDGVAHLDEIAAAEAPQAGLSQAETLRYLRDNLHFRLGPQEREGLELFYRYAAQCDGFGRDR